MTSVSYGPADGRVDGQGYVNVSILEGTTVQSAPAVAGSPFTGQPMRSILPGPTGTLRFDDIYLSKHVLFIGGIGTGKTNAMMHMLRDLRNRTGEDDVFVIFDTKGDFLGEFYRPGDAVVSTRPQAQPGEVIWNLISTEVAAASRQQLVSQLADLPPGAALPPQMLQELSGAWQASTAVDSDYARWALDEEAGSCVPDDTADPNFQAASGPNEQATHDKLAFTRLWNQLAANYELTQYGQGQL